MKDWVVVFSGREDEAAAARAALGAAGIESVTMADNGYLPGVFNLITTVEVAVQRTFALEASHVLRLEPPADEEEPPRRRRPAYAVVALILVICLLLLAGFVVLPALVSPVSTLSR